MLHQLLQSIITALISKLIGEEVHSFVPHLSQRLLRYHVSKLPSDLSERMSEEWNATLNYIPGNLGKLLFALDLFRATKKISYEFSNRTEYRPLNDLAIRSFDKFFSAFVVFLFLPWWVLIPLLIWFEDRGPIFYKERRLGKDLKPFVLLKFRTTKVLSESSANLEMVESREPIMTRVGVFLWKTTLDEIPQFINVWRGDMSIVGPTPLRVPKHITSEEGTILENLLVPEDFTIRQSVRPGMTGMAQLCDEMDFKRWNRLDFDLMYIKKRSPVLYLKLILKSCWVVFKRPR